MESKDNDGLSLDSEDEDFDKEKGEVVAVLGGVLGGDVTVGGIRVGSRTTTPTVVADGGLDGGLEVIEAGELGIPMIPPFATQQFTKGHYVGPHPLQMQQQLSFTLEVINPPQQLVAPLIAQQPWLDTPGLGTTQTMVLQAFHCNGLGGNGRAVQLQAMQPPQ